MLAMNYLSFVVSGFVWKLFTEIKADFVFIFEVSPMTQALPGVWYAKKRKIPCYLYVQDLWPENVEIITGIKNKFVIGSIGKMVDHIYKRCTKIFTTSKSFVGSIQARGVPADKIEYWPQYAEDFYRPMNKKVIPEIPDDGAFNIIYTGNIGTAQGLAILPETATLLKNEKLDHPVRFNIVGDGRYKNELVKLIESKDLSNMFNFIPKLPAARIPELLAACDAAFLSLIDNPLFAMTIPAKLQSYMACGIPVIASAAGETENILNEAKAGVCSPPGKTAKLARNIIELTKRSKQDLKSMGANASNYCENNFNKNDLLNKMDIYFE